MDHNAILSQDILCIHLQNRTHCSLWVYYSTSIIVFTYTQITRTNNPHVVWGLSAGIPGIAGNRSGGSKQVMMYSALKSLSEINSCYAILQKEKM